MRKLSKILVLVLVLMTMITAISSLGFNASAVTMTGGEILYLKPGSNWLQSTPRFAAYFFNSSSNKWVNMTDDNGDGIYEVKVPSGSWTNVIFCRMNGSSTTNGWTANSQLWNQTNDLTYDGTKNLYTVANTAWSKGSGTWSSHTTTVTIAGCQMVNKTESDSNMLGTKWDVTNTANDMTYSDGVYTKVYTGVAAGTYQFKCAYNHVWDYAYPSSNYEFTVEKDNSTVAINFNPLTKEVGVTVTHVHIGGTASCTAKAVCTVCGASYGELADHTEKTLEAVAPDCENTGLTEGKECSVCGATIVAQTVVAAKGHTEVTVAGKDATCTATGLTDGKKCSVCGTVTVKQAATDKLAHTEETVAGKDATCTATGLTDGKHCTVCGEVTLAQQTIALKEHTAGAAVKENEVAATCKAAGSYDSVVKCSVCSAELSRETKTVAKLAHTEVAIAGKAATCTEKGLTEGKKCSVCGEVTLAQTEVVAKGHSFSEGTCGTCGAVDPDYVAPPTTKEIIFGLGANGSASHYDGSLKTTYSETVNGYTLSITDGTNMYTGARDAKGNACIKLGTSKNVGSFSFTVPADVNEVVINIAKYKSNTTKITVNGTTYTLTKNSDNGAYDAIEVDTSTTKKVTISTVSGSMRAMVNSIVFVVTTSEPTCEHKNTEAVGTAIDATCTEAGKTSGKKCKDCGVTIEEQKTIPATGHTFVGGVCSCGEKEPNYIWQLVTDVADLKAGDLVIIVAKDSNVAMSTTQNNNNRGQATVTKDGQTIVITDGVQVFTLENGKVSGTFAFHSDLGYLYAASSSNNYLKSETTLSNNSSWKITITDGTASVVAQGSYTRNTMQYNQTSSLFAAYGSASQKAIAIYKQVEKTTCTHTNTTTTTVPATCLVAGSTTVTCGDCGEVVETTEIPALGHKEVAIAGKDATCTATGLTDGKKCSVCGEITLAQTTISALGHAIVVDKAVAPTCTATGLTAGEHCTRCDHKVAQEVVDALGHEWVDATFDAPKTCSACGTTEGSALVAAAKIGDVKYETLQEALDAAVDGDTITLLADVKASKYLDVKTANAGEVARVITLNLNGHTITPADGYNYNSGYPLVFVGINQTLTIKGEGTISAAKKVTIGVYGVLHLEGGTIVNEGKTEDDAAIDIYYWNHDLPSYEGIVGGTGYITGGNIQGIVWVDEPDEDGFASLEISGGTFTTDVSKWVADGFDLDENGTVIVHVHSFIDGKCTACGDFDPDYTVVESLDELKAALLNGGNILLNADITSSEIIVIGKPTVLVGGGHTITSKAARAINISGANGVTIKNLTVVASGERAFNVIQNATNVVIENVTATAANYTFNIATSAPNAAVTIKNSTLTGLCTVNVSAAGAKVTIDKSIINCNDNNTTAGEAYAALSLNREAIGGSIVATNTTINVAEGSDSVKGRNGAENGTVTINGATDGVVVIVAVITYEGSNYYYGFTSLENAIEFAKNGDTIKLMSDVTVEKLEHSCQVNIDLNGYTLTAGEKVLVHNYVAGEVVAPTFDAKGYTVYKCSCGKVEYRDEVPALVAVATVNGEKYTTLQEAVNSANGEKVVVLVDINLTSSIVVDGLELILDLNGKTINASYEAKIVEVLLAKNDAKVTITGNGTMLATGEGEFVEVISAIDGAVVTIENGTFVSDGCTTIYATRGAIVNINAGRYEAKELYNSMRFLLDVNEAESVLGVINVYGGEFVAFNPANHNNDGAYSNKLVGKLHAIATNGVYVVGAHKYESKVTAPTCTAAGYTTYTCVCGDTYTSNEVAALGHDYDAVVTDPDCLNGGYTTYTCKVCGYTYVADEVAALGHTVVVDVAVAPTFTSTGLTEGKHCSVCEKVLVAQEVIPAKVAVAQIGDVKYETLQEAFDAAVSGDVIKLVADVKVSKYLDIKAQEYAKTRAVVNMGEVARDITLDLNGYSISPAEDYNYNTGYPLVFVGVNQTLTIKGEGTISADKKVTVGVYGTLNIEGGTIVNTGATEDDGALQIYYWNNDLPSYEGIVGGTGYITGGNIQGDVYVDEADEDGEATLEISGGKFTVDVSEWATDGFKVLGGTDENGNVIFGVMEEATIPYIQDGYWWIDGINTGVKAEGTDGEDGKTPKLKLENGHLFVSYDDGATWEDLGIVGGTDGSGTVVVIKPMFKLEGNNLFVSLDNGETWEDLGTVKGEDGEDGKPGEDGEDGNDGQPGTDGEDGKTPSFKLEDGHLWVSFDNGATWTDLGNVKGEDGEDGKPGEDGENGNDGQPGTDGEDGKTPSFKVENGNLFVSFDNGVTWEDLGPVKGEDGKPGQDGEDGEDGKDGVTPLLKLEDGVLYVSYDNGATWTSLGNINGVDGKPGEDGKPGQDGEDGEDGKDGTTPQLKVENGVLYVSYDNGATWEELANIKGEDGEDGKPGQDGEDGEDGKPGQDGEDGEDGKDGVTPLFKIENGHLHVSYDNGETWTDLGNIQGADGSNGNDGSNGSDGNDGNDGEDGKDGVTPQLRINPETNEWEVSYDNGETWTSLGVKATGDKGEQGDKGEDGKDGSTFTVEMFLQSIAHAIVTLFKKLMEFIATLLLGFLK